MTAMLSPVLGITRSRCLHGYSQACSGVQLNWSAGKPPRPDSLFLCRQR